METMPPAPSTRSLKEFSRLTTATSSQSTLGHDSRHRQPPSSDLKVPSLFAKGPYYITGDNRGKKKRPKYEWSAVKQLK